MANMLKHVHTHSVLHEQGFTFVFDWTSWVGDAQRLIEDPATLATADLLTLRKLITAHVRGERFTEGHLASMFERGHIVAVLKRLQQLRDVM